MKSLTATTLGVLLILSTSVQAGTGDNRPPNIIYILADDLGYGDLSCYGQEAFETPQLDRMAREGMRFTQHYAGAPICAPSRASLMTGLHVGNTEIRSNRNDGEEPPYRGNYPLPDDSVTIAEVLKGAGYQTALIGKWGLGGPRSTGAPWLQGFDFSYGFLDQMDAHFYYPEYMWRNEEIEWIPENRNGKRGCYSHDLLISEALKYIESAKESKQPFFLYLSYTIPHAELLVPEAELAKFSGKFGEEEPYSYQPEVSHYAAQAKPKAAYAAMVSILDRDVGRIIDTLIKDGLQEDTLVIFSSDNGPAREGGANPEFFDSTAGLRGMKRSVAEGGIRVPMIAWWPGSIPAASETDHLSAFWDVGATLADLGGTEWPVKTDGLSFAPTLLGDTSKQSTPPYMFWAYGSQRAIRLGDWKGLYFHRKGALELYNLKVDPGETKDLANEYPVIHRIMMKALSEADTPHPDWKIARPKFEILP